MFGFVGALTLSACSEVVAPPATTQEPKAPATANPGPPPAPAPAPAPPPAPRTDAGPPVEGGAGPSWGASFCPPGGNKGFAVGDVLGDLVVKDCETGADASLDEVCGASAAWIFAAHTHCPTCQSTASFTDDVAAAVAGKNVAVVQLVYDDNGTTCSAWQKAYKLAGIPNVRVYDDPRGAAFSRLKVSNFTAPSVFLDKDRRITFKEHALSKAMVLSRIDEALAK